ncbi:DUF499 domain-containing protein [Adhaeretor mobilis]|uniref:DUF499 domain-containing protein n=1 Tax=Adhaeretor mobilis TaxID=1930276 RepID=A0A517MS16_9BACT|nr:DUF499 domain-containing protein [Adhaeretor mobilis]QDS97680.1 hypothetical protein HG15A2_09440 [Adhaeretor mobilis]
MVDLQLREEFKGKRLKGTTVDFTNQSKTGALQRDAADFLRITYPSHDLLKTIEATGPGQSRPLALIGSRGQGKSHLMAALYHLCKNPEVGREWLDQWADVLKNPKLAELGLREDCHVIAESMHLQRYQYLWDVIFENHPKGEVFREIWERMGDKKTNVPSYDLMYDMFKEQPTMLIVDEFQTWYEGLTNTKQYPRRNWAFIFIQILSEIAQKHPELLVLAVSVREGSSDAYQQVRRVNPVDVDFKGPYAKRDRQRLLLYRIFENRMQAHEDDIKLIIENHLSEYFRLGNVPQQEQEKKTADFVESWPFAPHLLQLLDDQVLVATDAQEARDLIKILVDLFKNHEPQDAIITAADFSLTSEKSAVGSLLDSVANQEHKDLREKAQRNLEVVLAAVPNAKNAVPHAEEIISSLWLRSLNVEQLRGSEPETLQIDITRANKIDDNAFEVELANIVDNSFNIHQVGGRLIFRQEENARAKLLSYAKNDKLFKEGEHAGQGLEHLAKEIRAVLGGDESVSAKHRIVVLKTMWNNAPWSEFEENQGPKAWDDKRLTTVVIPELPEKHAEALGKWLKEHLQDSRNTIRFLLPQKGTGNVYYDRDLVILARAVYLANEWHKNDTKAGYAELARTFRKDELIPKIRSRFDRLCVLSEWNYAEPAKCIFEESKIDKQGDKIPEEIDRIVREEMFIPEEFEEYVAMFASDNESVGKLLKDLREPRPHGKPCIPWLGETELKERVEKLCADGVIALNIRGTRLMQAKPGEDFETAWRRMKGQLPTGTHLNDTTIQKPDSSAASGGKPIVTETGGATGTPEPGTDPISGGLFGGGTPDATGTGEPQPGTDPTGSGTAGVGTGTAVPTTSHSAPATSALNLLGQIEDWGINPGTPVTNVRVSVGQMTGAQLQKLIKDLPDGVTYSLELEKEADN